MYSCELDLKLWIWWYWQAQFCPLSRSHWTHPLQIKTTAHICNYIRESPLKNFSKPIKFFHFGCYYSFDKKSILIYPTSLLHKSGSPNYHHNPPVHNLPPPQTSHNIKKVNVLEDILFFAPSFIPLSVHFKRHC